MEALCEGLPETVGVPRAQKRAPAPPKDRRFNRTTVGMAVTLPPEEGCEQAYGRLVGVGLGGVTGEPCCRERGFRSSGRETRRTGLCRRLSSATGKAATTARAGRIRPPVLVGRAGHSPDRPRPAYRWKQQLIRWSVLQLPSPGIDLGYRGNAFLRLRMFSCMTLRKSPVSGLLPQGSKVWLSSPSFFNSSTACRSGVPSQIIHCAG